MIEADIHHHGIVVFKNCLPAHFCEGLIEIVTENDRSLKPVDHTNSEYSVGTQYKVRVLNLEDSAELDAQFNQHIDSIKLNYFGLLGLADKQNIQHFSLPTIKAYSTNDKDQFSIHFDSRYDTTERALTLIWYLADVADGGETIFPFHDVSIKPSQGSCLVFPSYWNYTHLAKKPMSNDKYVLVSFGEYTR